MKVMMNDNLQNLMREATQLTQAGRLSEATAIIQRALRGENPAEPPLNSDVTPVSSQADASSMVLDGCVFEVPGSAAANALQPNQPKQSITPDTATFKAPSSLGEFISDSHTHAGLTRRYKLYVPPGPSDQPRPLVVMLHGCTQNPDDFAAGTAMNERARAQGFFVLYPEQSKEANAHLCWNWFKHNHQQRGRGEPALIADMTQRIVKLHGIDTQRVYIAGLSAGAAMASLVGEAYREIFAAVGVHSGLPNGAARNAQQAFAVMKDGASSQRTSVSADSDRHRPMPTIVFHGDQDKTVNPVNGEQVIATVLTNAVVTAPAHIEQGQTPNGRRYTRSTHHDDRGKIIAELWLVHGAGHAWSGGGAKGSYTDAKGPDATGEILRFFFEHPQDLLT